MGRRAKNKQGDPVPIRDAKENAGRLSPKKLGKRKAEDVDSKDSSRPVKKAKGKAELRTKGKLNIPGKGVKVGHKSKVKPAVLGDAGTDSEGWEDVEDGVDLKSQAMYVAQILS
jgi:25S rRNA (cytosine2870-C5)-methyltransferase